jgi:solute carrier family 35 protein F5
MNFSLIGVSLVSYADKNASNMPIESPSSPSNPLLGDILALLGAFFYGCYTILLKVRIQDESRLDMSLFFGFVGAFNVVLLWPCFGILHALGIERLELPSTAAVWGLIFLNALIGTFL